jgi:hypothetical protein
MKPAALALLLILPACTQQACQPPLREPPVSARPPAPVVSAVPPQAPTSLLWPAAPSVQPVATRAPHAKPSVTARPPAVTPKPKKRKKAAKPKKPAPAVRATGGVVRWWCTHVPGHATASQIVAGAKERGRSVSYADAQACISSKN